MHSLWITFARILMGHQALGTCQERSGITLQNLGSSEALRHNRPRDRTKMNTIATHTHARAPVNERDGTRG